MQSRRENQAALRRWPRWIPILLTLGLGLLAGVAPATAQGDRAIQILTGRIEPGEVILYLLPDLRQGQRLYIRMENASGNLDPALGIIDAGTDPAALEAAFEVALDQAAAEGADLFETIEGARDEYLLAWDDDSGGGLTPALDFEVPADGDYRLLATGALSIRGGQTFGDYRLLIGLDAPQVLEGNAEPTGETIAVPDLEATPPGVGVQEVTGSLTPETTATFVQLHSFKPGDALYVYLEATSGDLIPTIELQNFARKPIRSGNLGGSDTVATLQYTFPVESHNFRIEIAGCCADGPVTTGDYRLLVGVNEPEVLTGRAEIEGGRDLLREPLEVRIGIRVEQIVDLDQRSEFFTAVVSLQMEWTDPALAFNPEDCSCAARTYSGSGLEQFLASQEVWWPEFTVQNQQGNRWIQNQNMVVWPDGSAIYYERFTTDLQVDFDFRQYPFDTQTFEIRVEALFPDVFYRFAPLEDFAEISPEHGEDEFLLTDFETFVSSTSDSSGRTYSRFTFSYDAPRHLSYYAFSIFIPILLIIIVSWITFFLKDYGQRIEVASANLLLFIAFSWSLSENYPRLGYLTFLDAVMAIMFVVNAFVVVYNVLLKRLEMRGQGDRAEQIDRVLDWVYPLTYIVLFGAVIVLFF
jgi:hypothetical protein